MKKLVGLLLFLAISPAWATQTTVFARACPGCNDAAMQKTAANYRGFVFVYDLNAPVIRKFNVYYESTCMGTNPLVQETGQPAATGCGFKPVVDEWPVDDSVKSVFGALVRVYQKDAALATGTREQIPLRNLPNDPTTGKPFDLPQAAWEYPQGTYYRFAQMVTDIVTDSTALGKVDAPLSDFLYGFQGPSVNGVTIGIGVNPTGPSVSANMQLVWDRNTTLRLQVCDESLNCANFDLTQQKGQSIQLAFKNVVDLYGNSYPEPSVNYPSTPRWRWSGAGGGDYFMRQIGRNVDLQGLGACNLMTLVCSWKGNELIGCYVDCQ